MALFAPMQALSALITVLIIAYTGTTTTWLSVVFALGFVHYLLALVYSRQKLVNVLSRPATLTPFLAVVAAGTALYLNDIPLYLYFAFHHAFNEVYVRSALHSCIPGAVRRRTATVLFHLAAYTLLLTAQYAPPVVVAGLGVLAVTTFAMYLRDLLPLHRELGTARFIDLCAIEIAMLALLPVAFFYHFTFEQLVFYHFVFWAFYPLSRMLARAPAAASLRYVAASVALFAVFLFLSPIGPALYNAPVQTYYEQFIFWSYLHITLSFALSEAHPRWITTWFAPRRPAVAHA